MDETNRDQTPSRFSVDTDLRQLEEWFTYHAPNESQKARYAAIRSAGHSFALLLLNTCPPGPDRSAAVRQIREAVMTANMSIACGEL